MNVMGLDMGFRKTGVAIVDISKPLDDLIYAEIISPKIKKKPKSVLNADIEALLYTNRRLDALVAAYNIKATFIECPPGGGQGARSLHCMGMAKATLVAFQYYHSRVAYEIYTPGEVERAIGAALKPGEAKALGLTKAQRSKWKKERLMKIARAAWPSFTGWPVKKVLSSAEDAYDAAAAFLAGRANDNLYGQLKTQHEA